MAAQLVAQGHKRGVQQTNTCVDARTRISWQNQASAELAPSCPTSTLSMRPMLPRGEMSCKCTTHPRSCRGASATHAGLHTSIRAPPAAAAAAQGSRRLSLRRQRGRRHSKQGNRRAPQAEALPWWGVGVSGSRSRPTSERHQGCRMQDAGAAPTHVCCKATLVQRVQRGPDLSTAGDGTLPSCKAWVSRGALRAALASVACCAPLVTCLKKTGSAQKASSAQAQARLRTPLCMPFASQASQHLDGTQARPAHGS